MDQQLRTDNRFVSLFKKGEKAILEYEAGGVEPPSRLDLSADLKQGGCRESNPSVVTNVIRAPCSHPHWRHNHRYLLHFKFLLFCFGCSSKLELELKLWLISLHCLIVTSLIRLLLGREHHVQLGAQRTHQRMHASASIRCNKGLSRVAVVYSLS